MAKNNKTLMIHCHTTGMNFGEDITLNNQALSVALGVVDMATLKFIETMNITVAFDTEKYIWNSKLESIHGISSEEAINGESLSDAAGMIAEFIFNNFGANAPITVMGYNPLSFHIPFINKILKSEDLNHFKFSNRDIDLFPIMTLLNCFSIKETYDYFDIDQTQPLSSLFNIKIMLKIYKTIQNIIRESFNA